MEEKAEQYLTASPQETQLVAKNIVRRLLELTFQGSTSKEPLVLAMYGDLGSGKTTFVQGLAKGLGIKRRIISPTFVIVRHYEINTNFKFFYHIDLYRIDSKNDLEGLGIEEILDDPQNIVAIEWAEKLGDLLPERRVDIRFEYLDKEKRKIIINNSKVKSSLILT